MVHVPVKRLGEQQGGGRLKTTENYSEDEKYMSVAIELAKKGYGYTAPNPVVGAVIVKDGCIIGQGYHEKYGEPHAERNALASCSQSPEGATIYVTLEPCCHHGKQPPCTDAIIEAGISRVVTGSGDPNPLVGGKGIRILKDHKERHYNSNGCRIDQFLQIKFSFSFRSCQFYSQGP